MVEAAATTVFTFEEEEQQSQDDEEEGLEDEPEISPFRDDFFGMTLDESAALDADNNSKDKWRPLNNVKATRFSIGIGLTQSWQQAQREIEFVRGKLEQKVGVARPKKMGLLVDLVVGDGSEIFSCFKEEGIFDTIEEFHSFLLTFLLSCLYQVSCKQLFCKHSRIKLDGAMTAKRYIECWKKIGNSSLPSPTERNKKTTPAGMVPFWMKLEASFNKFSRDLFIKDFPMPVCITIDDDKSHVDNRKYNAGLKTVRHVKDNKNGNSCHTQVLAYSQIPVQIAWEREVGDSSPIASKRMVSNSMTPMAAPGEPGDLSEVNINHDRGYWDREMLFDYYMKGGAKIAAGTARRQPCIGMTYDQKLHPNDSRTDIPKRGPKTLFSMKTTSHGRDLFCLCYRNGTGGLVLGISTEYGEIPQWEGVLANPKDLAFYEALEDTGVEDILIKCFPRVELDSALPGIISGDFLAEVKALPVRCLTTTQRSAEWFMLRKFSLTSSTTDKAIAMCNGTEEWLDQAPSWVKVKTILGRVSRPREIPQEAAATGGNNDGEEEKRQDNDDNNNEELQQNGNVDETITLELLLASGNEIARAKNQVADGETDIEEVRLILTTLGHNLSKATSDSAREKSDLVYRSESGS